MKALFTAACLAVLLVGCNKPAASGGSGAKADPGFGSGPAVAPGKMILHRGNGSEPYARPAATATADHSS
jgi:hypothetical protein